MPLQDDRMDTSKQQEIHSVTPSTKTVWVMDDAIVEILRPVLWELLPRKVPITIRATTKMDINSPIAEADKHHGVSIVLAYRQVIMSA